MQAEPIIKFFYRDYDCSAAVRYSTAPAAGEHSAASTVPSSWCPVLQYLLAVLQAGDGWVGDALLDPLPPRLAGAAAEAVPGRARQRVGLHSGYRVQSGRGNCNTAISSEPKLRTTVNTECEWR